MLDNPEEMEAQHQRCKEAAAFCEYINQKMGGNYLTATEDGNLNIKALYSSLSRQWPAPGTNPKTINQELYTYEDFDRYFGVVDIPFDQKIRDRFPHIAGYASNFKDLLPQPVRNYMAVVDYYWKEQRLDAPSCRKVVAYLINHYEEIEQETVKDAIQTAKNLIHSEFVSFTDLADLASAVFSNIKIFDNMDTSTQEGTSIKEKEFDGTAKDVRSALNAYVKARETEQKQTDLKLYKESNPCLLALARHMSVYLGRKLVMPNTVLHFLDKFHEESRHSDTSHINPANPKTGNGETYKALRAEFMEMKDQDKGQNKGWISR